MLYEHACTMLKPAQYSGICHMTCQVCERRQQAAPLKDNRAQLLQFESAYRGGVVTMQEGSGPPPLPQPAGIIRVDQKRFLFR